MFNSSFHCLIFDSHSLMSVFNCPMLVSHFPMLIFHCPRLVSNCPMLNLHCQMLVFHFNIRFLLSNVGFLMSDVIFPLIYASQKKVSVVILRYERLLTHFTSSMANSAIVISKCFILPQDQDAAMSTILKLLEHQNKGIQWLPRHPTV